MINFLEKFNNAIVESQNDLEELFNSITSLPSNSYLRLHSSRLCNYDKNYVYFDHNEELKRLKIIFNLKKHFYSLSENEYFFRDFDVDQMVFLKDTPNDFLQTVFLKFQYELFNEYYKHIDKKAEHFLHNLKEKIILNGLNGDIYPLCLSYFISKGFSMSKKKNKFVFEKNIFNNVKFIYEINVKIINNDFKQRRFPVGQIFIRLKITFFEKVFFINEFYHAAINPFDYVNGFRTNDIDGFIKWMFIQCDVDAYYFNMFQQYYEKILYKVIEDSDRT